jgi:uncharacterized protein YgiM (DUF1202 family)
MFERFIVKRSAYDHDMATLRNRIADLNKQLREQEKEKGEIKHKAKNGELEVAMLHNEIKQLNKKLKKSINERDLQEYINPVPAGAQERRDYMAQVAMIYHGGLRDKLNYMLTQFKNQTGMFPLTERETDFFRSCINVVGLLLDWGEECVNEHNANIARANQIDEENVFDEEEEAVKKIKRTVSK